jgi:hypothetical protein
MIQLPVVGEHDYRTKVSIMKEVRGAHTLKENISEDEMVVYKLVYNAWPSSSMYEIVDRFGRRMGDPWFTKIDLGDGDSLSAYEFAHLVYCMYKENDKLTTDEVVEYLKRLIDTEVGVYKVMRRLDSLNRENERAFNN